MPKSGPPKASTTRPPNPPQLQGGHGGRGPADFLVVGIGASAGGLDACSKLMDGLPPDIGMAFILVQHLDPTHVSLMADLLAAHTTMTVRQATEGMPVEPGNLYVIPPGTYLAVNAGTLHLSPPQARHGARLPFDFLLHSLAQEFGDRSVAVILSGTGADGSVGLTSIKERGGLVIAQDPNEAGYDGMPRSAIMTGEVDLVLPVAKVPDALVRYERRISASGQPDETVTGDARPEPLSEIVGLLRMKTDHDFSLYKPGTLRRRIERRMTMSAIDTSDMLGYLKLVRSSREELDRLAKDLLINVTGFFRDPKVFDLLAEKIIPDMVRRHPPDRALRIWVAGCSTGQETYSLAMLFHERIEAAQRPIKLQIFSSDIDADAIAFAREGFYPEAIGAEVSPQRLVRFFLKEDQGYRIVPELRAMVAFTVQDILFDPPFSRLDMVSYRNLLIYLRPEAQAKVISLFHFSLLHGGILLLGTSETTGALDDRFELIAKSERIYRHVGRSRTAELGFPAAGGDGVRPVVNPPQGAPASRPAALAELCRRLLIETYAPAAVLIDANNECLYSIGAIDRYLHFPSGSPTNDLLAVVPPGIRTKLRSAIQLSGNSGERNVVPGFRINHGGQSVSFSIDVRAVRHGDEQLRLICFVDDPQHQETARQREVAHDLPRVLELEHELEATRAELQSAIHDLKISAEEQKAIHEEALSVNEEFQSTNEELLTSKEELQSLNEELIALNSQLQESLEQQRTTSSDLQNVLYSTDVATLFLDTDLRIRFFTPATRSLFNVIPSDVGRPLSDLHSLAADVALTADAKSVLQTRASAEREIEVPSGTWFNRRILPYRTHNGSVAGVVITFTDVTERKLAARALESAKHQAEQANKAKSRFLAAASHDLRQPLQTLALLQGLLARAVEGDRARNLVARLDETLGAMSGMLDTLLDINQIEAGTIHPEVIDFPVSDIFEGIRDEFRYHAQARGLTLRVVPCSVMVRSDPRLLGQIVRNLLSNAMKYTRHGKVLLGCRRREGILSIEVWDTGIGIPEAELEAIFDEYHQVDNAARERSQGLGLGLAIVRRLGDLLGHHIRVRSTLGKGSVFAIEAMRAPQEPASPPGSPRGLQVDGPVMTAGRHGTVLIIEDDPEVGSLLELLLTNEGHRVATALDGPAALELVAKGTLRPDIILADYNLPNGMHGLVAAAKLRQKLYRHVPAIILTGDIATCTLRDIALQDCVRLSKPVKALELIEIVSRLLASSHPEAGRAAPSRTGPAAAAGAPAVFVVDDDANVREAIRGVLEEDGHVVATYATSEAFLADLRPDTKGCLLIDAYLPGMSGMALLHRLADEGSDLQAIMITGRSDVHMAVEAMKAGACDFIEKPVSSNELTAAVAHALDLSGDASKRIAWQADAATQLQRLTPRQRQIMELVLAGQPSKNIAADLGISQRTVENHRASIMRKTGSKSLPALARLALAAAR